MEVSDIDCFAAFFVVLYMEVSNKDRLAVCDFVF